jgi:hypothetical protein
MIKKYKEIDIDQLFNKEKYNMTKEYYYHKRLMETTDYHWTISR